MFAHKLRLALTTASIALGVAFLSGTFILTDTVQVAFTQLFGNVSSGTDAVVRQHSSFDLASGVGTSRTPVAADVLGHVRAVPGVAAAEGRVSGYALLTDKRGRAVVTKGGFPTQGYSMPVDPQLRGSMHVLTGRSPASGEEVAIDAASAGRGHIRLGDRIKVLFRGPTRSFTVVGTVGYGSAKDLGGTSSALFDVATAQQVLGKAGVFDQIVVRGAPGVGASQLAHRLGDVVPHGVEAVTSAQVAKEDAKAIDAQFKVLNVMFGIFAGIALFVGAFIIWNTFTMIVTQRRREIALLRAIGATRRQIRRALLAEATMLGVGAAAVGLALGMGVARALSVLMDFLGFTLPSASLQVTPRTVIVSMLVGTVVTIVSAVVPSRRAMKVLPVEALREAQVGVRRASKLRTIGGGLLTGAGVGVVLLGLYGGGGSNLVLLGLPMVLFGVISLAPVGAAPLARTIGKSLSWRGLTGDLAKQNAMRNPRRTASTAAALMIGVTLVVGMGVFASSLKASFGTILGTSTHADLYVTASSVQSGGFSPESTRAVAAVPGVRAVTATSYGGAQLRGEPVTYAAVDPGTVEQTIDLDVRSGSPAQLGSDGLLVSTSAAKAHGWSVGSTVPFTFPATGVQALQVRGTYASKDFFNEDFIISTATQEANGGDRLDSTTLVLLDDERNVAAMKKQVAAALADHPDAQVLDRKGYEKAVTGIVDQLLALVTAMLMLAVLIALLGIVNTLALSVFERRRELGLLRAVGMTREQVRAMVRWEAAIISVLGAGAGAVLGIGLGTALSQSLKGDGITQVAVPAVSIAVYVVGAAVAGFLAAVGPARSAARVDVLQAVVVD
jgi:putative ABC transport system permease protein